MTEPATELVPHLAPLDGEIIAPERTLPVYAAMHPMKASGETIYVPEGSTLAEMIRASAGINPRGRMALSGGINITLNGEPIPPALWPRVRPKVGTTIATAVAGPIGAAYGAAAGAFATAAIAFGGDLRRDAFSSRRALAKGELA